MSFSLAHRRGVFLDVSSAISSGRIAAAPRVIALAASA
jgi:hypothetical protein